MAEPKPGGIVNYPWLVLFGFVASCVVAALLSPGYMCRTPMPDRQGSF